MGKFKDWFRGKISDQKSEEFFLNWDGDKLWGWESPKSYLPVGAMIEEIKLNHKFPAVEVVKSSDYYMLAWGEGGSFNPEVLGRHNRAIAHYIENVPLRCRLLDSHRGRRYGSGFPLPIEDIILTDDNDAFGEGQLVEALSHLPVDIAEKFCNENGLDVDKYLSQ